MVPSPEPLLDVVSQEGESLTAVQVHPDGASIKKLTELRLGLRVCSDSEMEYVQAVSLSTMVNTAVLGEPSVTPPDGLLKVKLRVSLPSTKVSLMIGTVKVLLVSLVAKLSTSFNPT
jgi:hypothetical protein